MASPPNQSNLSQHSRSSHGSRSSRNSSNPSTSSGDTTVGSTSLGSTDTTASVQSLTLDEYKSFPNTRDALSRPLNAVFPKA